MNISIIGFVNSPLSSKEKATPPKNSLRRALDNDALLAFGSSPAQECSTGSILEDFPDSLTSAGGAFKVVARADLLSDSHALWFGVSSKDDLIS